MALKLTNFRPVGLDNAAKEIFVGDDGKIAGKPIDGAKTIDCGGSFLSPGWCDLHVHVWHGGTDISIRASEAGRATGVTAMADAGSSGEAAFHGLREYVIDTHQETIQAFLNIGSIGLVACNRVPELIDLRSIDVDRTLEVAEANRDVICGIKVRASGVISGAWGITPAKIAKRVAEILKLPLMVHIGEPPPLIDEVFDILTEGDIVTHCFNGKRAGSIRDTAALFKQAQELAQNGVRMDIGHGAASFSFDTARDALENGLKPFSISTDLHLRNVKGPVYDLATTMAKLLAVGMTFDDVITAVTENPRSIMGLGARNGVATGQKADFTIFDLQDSQTETIDAQGAKLMLDKLFEPKLTVIGASALAAERRQG